MWYANTTYFTARPPPTTQSSSSMRRIRSICGFHAPCDVQKVIVQLFSKTPSELKTEKRALAASRTDSLPSRAIAIPSASRNSPGPDPTRPITRTSLPSGANSRMSCVLRS